MNKFLAFSVAVAGFAVLPAAPVSAHETPAPASAASSVVRINDTVIVRERHHRRFRVERRRVRRHGRWVIVTRRIYY